MPPKAPPLPNGVIERALQDTMLTGQDIRALFRDPEWQSIASRNQQLIFLFNFASSNCGIGLSNQTLARVFEISSHQVSVVRSRGAKPDKPAHRPLSLNPQQEELILQFIEQGFSSGQYVTQRELLSFVENNFRKTLTYGWLASFLERWADHIARVVVSPQEQLRLQVPRQFLDQYIAMIKAYVPLVPAELIFNLDETGLSDWEERKAKQVIVPQHAKHTALHYPVDRTIRHHTLLCCVSASGDASTPLLICPRPSATRIFEKGIREHVDVSLEIRPTAYVDAALFTKYMRDVFLPIVSAKRELPGCANKPAILFCDNCAAHCSREILQELARNGVLLLTYPAHTSHLFQVLDVLLFGKLKAFKKYLARDTTEDREIDHILRILRAYEGVTTSMTIRGSWEKAGFIYQKRDQTFYLVIDEGRIRTAPDFQEIWNRDYPIGSLSARRRNQKWGWLNQEFFRVEFLEQINVSGVS